MICHIVLNGYAKDFERQAGELNGFLSKHCEEMQKVNTIIICGGKEDGDDIQRLAEMAPTKSVIFILSQYYDPQAVLAVMEENADDNDLYLFDSSFAGQELSVRFGKRRGGSSMTGVGRIWMEADQMWGEKLVYSSHMKGSFCMEQKPYAISVQKGYPLKLKPVQKEHSKTYHIIDEKLREWFVQPELIEEVSEESLNNAAFVIAAGHGIKNKEQANHCAKLAEELGAGYGVSRPVVMNALFGMDELIGVSGHILSPKLCLAVGVSGAPAFYAGIENSGFIAAVNTNGDAPIMNKADVAVIGDYTEILEEIAAIIREEGRK